MCSAGSACQASNVCICSTNIRNLASSQNTQQTTDMWPAPTRGNLSWLQVTLRHLGTVQAILTTAAAASPEGKVDADVINLVSYAEEATIRFYVTLSFGELSLLRQTLARCARWRAAVQLAGAAHSLPMQPEGHDAWSSTAMLGGTYNAGSHACMPQYLPYSYATSNRNRIFGPAALLPGSSRTSA